MSDTSVDGRSKRSRSAANWARMLALVAVALPAVGICTMRFCTFCCSDESRSCNGLLWPATIAFSSGGAFTFPRPDAPRQRPRILAAGKPRVSPVVQLFQIGQPVYRQLMGIDLTGRGQAFDVSRNFPS